MSHSVRKHAVLAPSSSHRWLNCLASARLEEHEPEQQSEFAAEGTAAHELADAKTKLELGLITALDYVAEVKNVKTGKFYDSEMEKHTDAYVSYIMEEYLYLKNLDEATVCEVESEVDFSDIVPEGSGHVDNIIVGNGLLVVTDLKYGRGVSVSAVDNSQLRLYGLGALRKYEFDYSIEKVLLRIFQPRTGNYSEEILTVEELTDWADSYVKPRAEQAFSGSTEMQAGEWCQFCKVAGRCPALKEKATKDALSEFDPVLLTDEEISQAYQDLDIINIYVKAVSDYVYKQALSGNIMPGLKLVNGRSVRTFTNEEEVLNVLKNSRLLKKEQYIQEKLLSLTALEKLLGDKFEPKLGDYITKTEPKPVLVPESDKRPAIVPDSAKDDFEVIEDY